MELLFTLLNMSQLCFSLVWVALGSSFRVSLVSRCEFDISAYLRSLALARLRQRPHKGKEGKRDIDVTQVLPLLVAPSPTPRRTPEKLRL